MDDPGDLFIVQLFYIRDGKTFGQEVAVLVAFFDNVLDQLFDVGTYRHQREQVGIGLVYG